eukprot:2121879-Prymnesium_polylepis.2
MTDVISTRGGRAGGGWWWGGDNVDMRSHPALTAAKPVCQTSKDQTRPHSAVRHTPARSAIQSEVPPTSSGALTQAGDRPVLALR